MNVILYGTKKCAETRKAERYLKERKLEFQFRDIGEKPLTEGELKNIAAGRDPAELLDTGSKAYIKKGFAFMEYDALEEILANPGLLATPILRIDRKYFIRPSMEDLSL
jgi:arsenate reductase (glutaredoxin)